MNKLIAILSYLLLFAWGEAASAQRQPSGDAATSFTQISGELRNVSDPFVSLTFFSDMVSFTEEIYQVPLDSLHRFSMRFHLNEPTQINFDYRGQNLRFYMEPGDDLHLRFNGSDFYSTLIVSGKRAPQNNYLQQTHRLHGQWDEANILYEMNQRQPMDFRRYMDGLRRQKWSFLNQFPGKEKFSEDFRYYAAADIDYWWAYYLLRYRTERSIMQGEEALHLPDKYYSFLDELVISNDRAISNPYYLFFLDQYLLYKEEESQKDVLTEVAEVVSILVDVSSLFVMTQPEQQPIVTEVKKGDRMRFLHEKSSFKSKILIKEALHEDYWYKVKTGDGHVGWAIGVGLIFEKNNKVDTLALRHSDNRRYQTAMTQLNGKALYYTLANDLYFRAQHLPLAQLEKEVADFNLLNPIKSYDQIMRYTLQVAKIKVNANAYYDATNYRIISEPETLTKGVDRGKVIVLNERLLSPKTKVELAILREAQSLGVPQDVVLLLEKMYQKQKVWTAPSKTNTDEKVVATVMTQGKASVLGTASFATDYLEIPLSNTDRPTSPVVLAGRLENNTGRTLQLIRYSDPITFTEEEYPIPLSPANTFHLDMKVGAPQFAFLKYGEYKMPVYIGPGDQLQIRFDGLNFNQTVQFTGKGNVANNYLVSREKRFANEEEDLRKQMKDLAPAAFIQYMNEQRTLRLEFLGNYEKAYAFEPGFAEVAKASVVYWYAYQLMNYPWEHPLSHDQEAPMHVPSDYYDFLQEIDLSNPYALPVQQYTYFLDQYFDYLSQLPENNAFTKIQLAEQHLNNEVLDFYVARLLTIACKRGKAKESGLQIKAFVASCSNEMYNDVLREAYHEAKGLSNGVQAPDFTLMDVFGGSVSLSQFKGKIVYLDFWASWCSPCVMQMRNSREWKAQFKEKDVVFVYVSLDKNPMEWQSFIKTLEGSYVGTHLIADTDDVYQSKIAKLYHVKRLPNVFILDKEGKVYYNSARDVSQQRISDMINHLLLGK
jgi:peroxiredoxin